MPLEGSRERITYIQPHDIISKGKHYLHSEVGQIMTTKLERISELSKQHPEMKFNSIGHLINIEMLKECHYKMDGRKAVGIDGISKEEYNSNLDNNLKQLVERFRTSVPFWVCRVSGTVKYRRTRRTSGAGSTVQPVKIHKNAT